nr:GNAT family N-acetyltransferase [Jiangella mangrovi]
MRVEPLTEALWPAFEELMADSGGPAARCWCMAWRLGPEYRKRPPSANHDDFRAVVAAGPPPGLLALSGDTAVGWCQLTPRDAVPALDRPWRLRRVDDVPVWAITCFYVRKTHRRRGVTSALVEAAVDHARAAGAPAVEAYPLDGTVSPSSTSTGYAPTFLRAGFTEVARRSPERPVLRLVLA